ncbi:MAG: hypothetical protein FWD17_08640 [Polyangiaceae bacterium]|nr:hypothetical protein [Polyangiaceae bacterium]
MQRAASTWLLIFGIAACGGKTYGAEGSTPGEVSADAAPGQASADAVPARSAPGAFAGSVDVISGASTSGAGQSIAGSPSVFLWSHGIGNWFLLGPPPASQTSDAPTADIVPPLNTYTTAFRVQGSGGDGGLDLFAQLNHPQGSPVDLSAYYGIGFWAKLDGASNSVLVALTSSQPYFNASGKVPSVMVAVPNDWAQFTIPFSSFGVDGSSVANIDFVAGAGGGAFDLWVTQLVLLCRGACPSQG